MDSKKIPPLGIMPEFGRPMRYVIFGLNSVSKERLVSLSETHSVTAFIDTFSEKNEFCGLPVFQPADYIAEFGTDDTVYIITPASAYAEICEQLIGMGVPAKYLIYGGTDNETICVAKTLLSKFTDETSKFIFINRFMYWMTSDNKYIADIADYVGVPRIVEKDIPHKANVLYSLSRDVKMFFERYRHEMHIDAIIEDSGRVKQYKGVPVLTPEEYFKTFGPDEAVIYILNWDIREKILPELKSHNVPDDYIAFDGLTFIPGEYFSEFPPDGIESFVDAGCFDGATTKEFIEWRKGDYKKVWAFEPEPEQYKNCVNSLSEYKNVTVFNNAVWSNSNEKLTFVSHSDGSYVNETGDGDVEVKTVTIDEIVGTEDVGFMKFDIEGSEYNALLGAKETIKRCKPKLAVCVYHKIEDIMELTKLVYMLNPDYNLKLRHYSSGCYETILYAY
jgi:FkbM family methyltransferase